jgi:two-component system sensor histidine kinase RegB
MNAIASNSPAVAAPARERRATISPNPHADVRGFLNGRVLRLIMLARGAVCLIGIAGVVFDFEEGIRVSPLIVLGIAAAVALLSWAALLHRRPTSHPSETELFLQVTCDIVVLTAMVSLTDGESPFDYLYLLPLVFGASIFAGWRMGLIASMVGVGWTAITLAHHQHPYQGVFALEVGMHLSIGALVAFCAYAVANLARKHERMLSGHRERALTALGAEAKGMLATQAAHVLSTPLGTMAVLVADLREGGMTAEEEDAALETLAAQIANCKLHLSGLLTAAGVGRAEGAYRANVIEILNEIREECLLHYPGGTVHLLRPAGDDRPPDTVMELSLFNALAGMVKDLAREAPHVAHVSTYWDEDGVCIEVTRGPAEAGQHSRSTMNTRRQERLAVLAAILERHAGSLETGPGERIFVRLPYAD